jgi:AcrR family transcriptional regulator
VLVAARELLAADGVGNLSMRALARSLGVAPNALYGHVGNRDQLIDLVLDDVLAQVHRPAEKDLAANPTGAVRDIMLSSYDVLVAHPGLMPAYLERQGARGVQAQQLGHVALDGLGRAGVEEATAREAMRVLIVYTIGFAALSARPADLGDPPLSPAELRANFRTGLDWLLLGIVGT